MAKNRTYRFQFLYALTLLLYLILIDYTNCKTLVSISLNSSSDNSGTHSAISSSEVPKGGVKVGEDISVAALRELLEETGYISEKLIYVGEYCDSPAIISGKVKCYLAPESYKISEKMCEKTEAILDVLEFDAKEFLGVQHQMDFIDALTELLV